MPADIPTFERSLLRGAFLRAILAGYSSLPAPVAKQLARVGAGHLAFPRAQLAVHDGLTIASGGLNPPPLAPRHIVPELGELGRYLEALVVIDDDISRVPLL